MARRGFDRTELALIAVLAAMLGAVVCIESHPPIRQTLIDYMSARGYSLLAKYVWIDRENFWFAPAMPR